MGEFLVEVSGSSVSSCDVEYPAVVGGTVAAVGEGCRRLKVGYRVWSDTGSLKGDSGGMATYAVTTELQTGQPY